jgi:4'-phosphopantetheinyl transferase
MTSIYYLFPENDLINFDYHPYLHLLPQYEQRKLMAFREKSDLCLSLYGKLILIQSFRDFNVPVTDLTSMILMEFRKPVLPIRPPLHFSISHCKNAVVVAVSNDQVIGIDIEKVVSVDLPQYQHVFTAEILNRIGNSTNSTWEFYLYWTRLESAIKAKGKGFLLDIKSACFLDTAVVVENATLYSKTIDLHKDYICSLASPCREVDVTINKVTSASFTCLLG